jgi:hypothetical protein
MFDKAIKSMLPGPLFLPASHIHLHNISEPPRPHALLIEHTCLQPALPITPLPEDSTKEDLSDEFEAVGHPRSQLPSAFFHMPNKPPFISSSLSLLTELSDQSSAYESCADRVGLQGLDKIKGIIKYLERDDRELWAGLPEAQASNYNAFMKEIELMYPGWDGKRRCAVGSRGSVGVKRPYLHKLSFDHSHYGVA